MEGDPSHRSPPCMSHRCGLSAPLPSTCWLMGSMALAGENC